MRAQWWYSFNCFETDIIFRCYIYLHISNNSHNQVWHENSAKGHDDVIKWKHFPRYWPFVRGIHRSPVNSPHKGQWRGALIFSLICAWINGWVNNGAAGNLRRYRVHSGVTVMEWRNQIVYKRFFARNYLWRSVSWGAIAITTARKEYMTCQLAERRAGNKLLEGPDNKNVSCRQSGRDSVTIMFLNRS